MLFKRQKLDLEKEDTASVVNEVVTEEEFCQRWDVLKAFQRRDAVVLQWQMLQACQTVEAWVADTGDEIVGEGKTLQLRPVGSTLDVPYTVVIKWQFLQLWTLLQSLPAELQS